MQANIKAILLAVSLIGASASAYATPVVTLLDSTPDSENYYIVHNNIVSDPLDYWVSFDVAGPRDITASISGTSTGSISFSEFALYANQYDAVALGSSSYFDAGAKLSFAGLSATSVDGPATYWIHIVGSYTGKASYNGNIAAIAAVPEPSTYGMLALGLGLIGFAARGRSKFSA